ncbi:hypothetical protein RHGRI_029264 [Rhododendron griersonianum]|uniref:Uncharacterized protein n=1 Tax=Rhododendron griersonianum TaxID=479676 RepID=A0AAV6IIS0_9ERIC|nr:hypothetical protein RHGRI_029264 [Rhododendron griersonianum]
MLRLNLYCSLVPGPRQPLVKTGISSFDSWVIGYHRAQKLPQRINAKAVKDEMDGGTRGLPSPSWDPGLEVEVPFEQRPVNEYSSLKDGGLYSWGELSPSSFFLRLGGLWLVTFTVLGAPIAAASFNPSREPLRFALAAGTGTLFLVSLIVLRIYLGWSYVGDRLLSAVIPYEETGWYDGQMWVKPPEVSGFSFVHSHYHLWGNGFGGLDSHFLKIKSWLGTDCWAHIRTTHKETEKTDSNSFCLQVKPVIKLLKQTLVGTGALLVSAVMLFIFATPAEDFIQNTFGTPIPASKNSKFNLRKEELLRLPVEVKADDDLAAAAAEAADGRPVYCRDRFYRALAGGQYCKWEDLVK